jgi:hypothetical protein
MVMRNVGYREMKNGHLIAIVTALCMGLSVSCRTTGSKPIGDQARQELLNLHLREVHLRNANVVDAFNAVQDQVLEQSGDRSLNLIIIVTQDMKTNGPAYLITYEATNVTVTAVFDEFQRQTGLETAFIRDASVVASRHTVQRLRRTPPLPDPAHPVLANKLAQRIEVWQDCTVRMDDVSESLDYYLGIKCDATEVAGTRDLFHYYRTDIRNMEWKTWLWWISVLSDTEITFVEDTVRITKKPNKILEDTGTSAPDPQD